MSIASLRANFSAGSIKRSPTITNLSVHDFDIGASCTVQSGSPVYTYTDYIHPTWSSSNFNATSPYVTTTNVVTKTYPIYAYTVMYFEASATVTFNKNTYVECLAIGGGGKSWGSGTISNGVVINTSNTLSYNMTQTIRGGSGGAGGLVKGKIIPVIAGEQCNIIVGGAGSDSAFYPEWAAKGDITIVNWAKAGGDGGQPGSDLSLANGKSGGCGGGNGDYVNVNYPRVLDTSISNSGVYDQAYRRYTSTGQGTLGQGRAATYFSNNIYQGGSTGIANVWPWLFFKNITNYQWGGASNQTASAATGNSSTTNATDTVSTLGGSGFVAIRFLQGLYYGTAVNAGSNAGSISGTTLTYSTLAVSGVNVGTYLIQIARASSAAISTFPALPDNTSIRSQPSTLVFELSQSSTSAISLPLTGDYRIMGGLSRISSIWQ